MNPPHPVLARERLDIVFWQHFCRLKLQITVLKTWTWVLCLLTPDRISFNLKRTNKLKQKGIWFGQCQGANNFLMSERNQTVLIDVSKHFSWKWQTKQELKQQLKEIQLLKWSGYEEMRIFWREFFHLKAKYAQHNNLWNWTIWIKTSIAHHMSNSTFQHFAFNTSSLHSELHHYQSIVLFCFFALCGWCVWLLVQLFLIGDGTSRSRCPGLRPLARATLDQMHEAES